MLVLYRNGKVGRGWPPTIHLKGARGVVVITVGEMNTGDTSSNPGRD